jgi:hypothetical protein
MAYTTYIAISPLTRDQLDRFNFYANYKGQDCCWEWRGPRFVKGYGKFKIGKRLLAAHRVMFFFANGFLPEVVMHKCDNPPCTNPSHLLPGTFVSNRYDCVRKGRHRHKLMVA